MHVFSLVGHGSLRVAVTGNAQRSSFGQELDQMSGFLEDSLQAGCAGFSTGLMYAPGTSATTGELEHLCRIVARTGKLYATHMRSYASGLVAAVREQLDLAQGDRMPASDLSSAGGGAGELEPAATGAGRNRSCPPRRNRRGIPDIYPYSVRQHRPDAMVAGLWAQEGGKIRAARKSAGSCFIRVANRAKKRNGTGRSYGAISQSPASAVSGMPAWVGKTIAEVAFETRNVQPVETAIDLLVEEAGAVNVVSFNQSEENLRQLVTHPLCSVISDGFYVKGKAHPRLYGTFPELLGRVTRELRWLPLTEAVHKITGKPAERLGLR